MTTSRRAVLAGVSTLLVAASAIFLGHTLPATSAASGDAPSVRVSGPYVYENLDLYLLHGADTLAGRELVPLQEALRQKQVVVKETGSVNELTIENVSNSEIYVQAGDIVKGGRQDRTLQSDLILPPKSGSVPVASHCVEQGRWTARGTEASDHFSSSESKLAHKDLKLANLRGSQRDVWANVSSVQSKLGRNLGTDVRGQQSASSLQLTLENERLRHNVAAYVRALEASAGRQADVIGYAFAVDGTLNAADVYASHALFVKLWPGLLRASAVEAVAEWRSGTPHTPPTTAAVEAFLAEGQHGPANEKAVSAKVRRLLRETEASVVVETREVEANGSRSQWIHKGYVRK